MTLPSTYNRLRYRYVPTKDTKEYLYSFGKFEYVDVFVYQDGDVFYWGTVLGEHFTQQRWDVIIRDVEIIVDTAMNNGLNTYNSWEIKFVGRDHDSPTS